MRHKVNKHLSVKQRTELEWAPMCRNLRYVGIDTKLSVFILRKDIIKRGNIQSIRSHVKAQDDQVQLRQVYELSARRCLCPFCVTLVWGRDIGLLACCWTAIPNVKHSKTF